MLCDEMQVTVLSRSKPLGDIWFQTGSNSSLDSFQVYFLEKLIGRHIVLSQNLSLISLRQILDSFDYMGQFLEMEL